MSINLNQNFGKNIITNLLKMKQKETDKNIDSENKVSNNSQTKYSINDGEKLLDSSQAYLANYNMVSVNKQTALAPESINTTETPTAQQTLITQADSNDNAANGEIDGYVKQIAGDCWLVSGVLALNSTSKGKDAIKNAIKVNDDGSVTVTFKGAKVNGQNAEYTISADEIETNRRVSRKLKSDGDMVAIELAVSKLFDDMRNPDIAEENKPKFNKTDCRNAKYCCDIGIDGGYAETINFLLTAHNSTSVIGKGDKCYFTEEQMIEMLSTISENNSTSAVFVLGRGTHKALETNGGTCSIAVNGTHGLAITGINNKEQTVSFRNPSNSKDKEYEMSWSEFAKLGVNTITYTDLNSNKFIQNGFEYTCDNDGRTIFTKKIDDGSTREYTYYENGNTKTSISKNAQGNVTSEIEYDSSGKVINEISLNYDKDGNYSGKETITYENNIETTTGVNARNQVTLKRMYNTDLKKDFYYSQCIYDKDGNFIGGYIEEYTDDKKYHTSLYAENKPRLITITDNNTKKTISRTSFTYKENGTLENKEITTYEQDNSKTVEIKDANDNLLEKVKYDSNGNPTKKIEYTYDKNGKETLKKEYINNYDENGKPVKVTTQEYKNGKLSKEIWSTIENNEVIGETIVGYDENGKKTSREHSDYSYKNGEKVTTFTEAQIFDENGHITNERKDVDGDGDRIFEKQVWSTYNSNNKIIGETIVRYDENGNKTKREHSEYSYKNGEKVKTFTEAQIFDENGHITNERQDVDSDGDRIFEKQVWNTYNSNNKIIGETTFGYDENGNKTKREHSEYSYKNGEKVKTFTEAQIFDENGHITNERQDVDSDGDRIFEKQVWNTYNSNNKIIGETIVGYDENGKKTKREHYETNYNEDNSISSYYTEIDNEGDGKIDYKSTESYLYYNGVLSEKTKNSTTFFADGTKKQGEIKYDANGKIISEKQY